MNCEKFEKIMAGKGKILTFYTFQTMRKRRVLRKESGEIANKQRGHCKNQFHTSVHYFYIRSITICGFSYSSKNPTIQTVDFQIRL